MVRRWARRGVSAPNLRRSRRRWRKTLTSKRLPSRSPATLAVAGADADAVADADADALAVAVAITIALAVAATADGEEVHCLTWAISRPTELTIAGRRVSGHQARDRPRRSCAAANASRLRGARVREWQQAADLSLLTSVAGLAGRPSVAGAGARLLRVMSIGWPVARSGTVGRSRDGRPVARSSARPRGCRPRSGLRAWCRGWRGLRLEAGQRPHGLDAAATGDDRHRVVTASRGRRRPRRPGRGAAAAAAAQIDVISMVVVSGF